MADVIRVGIVGANPSRGWSQQAHIPALGALPGFSIGAVATTRQESADQTAAALGGPRAYGDAARLMEDPEIDVVAVCVKVPYHYGLVRAALEAGKHVFSEWPLGANTAEAVELAELARSNGVACVVGLQGRKSPLINHVRDLIAEGYLGTVVSSTLDLAQGRGGPTVAAERVWAMDRAAGANTLTISTGHEVDTMRYCLGEFTELSAIVATAHPLVTVAETGEQVSATAPDSVFAQGVIGRADRPAGVLASVVVRAAKVPGVRFDIQGTEGALVISGPASMHLNDTGITLYGGRGDEPLAPIEIPPATAVPAEVPDGPGRNVAALYLDLAAAITGGAPVGPDFDTALSLHHLLDAMVRSSDTGERQHLA